MANEHAPTPLHADAGASPFGDESSPAENGSRTEAILSGNETRIAQAVVNVVLRGGALMLASVADEGAVGVHFFWGRTKESRYAPDPQTLARLLEALERWKPVHGPPRPTRATNGRLTRS